MKSPAWTGIAGLRVYVTTTSDPSPVASPDSPAGLPSLLNTRSRKGPEASRTLNAVIRPADGTTFTLKSPSSCSWKTMQPRPLFRHSHVTPVESE